MAALLVPADLNMLLAFPFVLAAFVSAASPGDAARGQQIYESRCFACHSIADNGPGPRHQGLFGRISGTQEGFAYSDALKAARITWDAQTIDRWLADPNAFVPGNRMVVRMAHDPQDRADLIAYLRQATAGTGSR